MSLEERFWSKVDQGDSGECWEWKGAINSDGYGNFGVEHDNIVGAHRVAYELEYEDPDSSHVRHKCDNPSCVNPDHLELGDHADNMRDLWERNPPDRQGETNGRAKLTEEEVREIKRYYGPDVTQPELAEEYGVSRSTISHIVNGRKWEWVEP